MAFDEYQAERIQRILQDKQVDYSVKKMMGGLCFMVDSKMLCGIHSDKKAACELLMARIGPDAWETALEKKGCQEMTFTGRSMKGYVFVRAEGFDTDVDLEYWIQLCLNFNPLAKASKKKKKKT